MVVIWAFGAFHCVRGARPDGCGPIIWKDEWGFYDQFPHLDDYAGHPVLEIIANGKLRTARALVQSGCVTAPSAPSE